MANDLENEIIEAMTGTAVYDEAGARRALAEYVKEHATVRTVYVLLKTYDDWEINDSTILGVFADLESAKESIPENGHRGWTTLHHPSDCWQAKPHTRVSPDFFWEIQGHEVQQ